VVAAHGSFADGLVSAVDAITGKGGTLRAVSNTGLSSADMLVALARVLDETGARVVFTDLPAGSCTLAARRLQRERPGLTVVTGVNLPLLLEFVLHDPWSDADVAAAVARGREFMRAFDPANVG
jgi:mannose/fructose-specific phosphotransferase system component IIA